MNKVLLSGTLTGEPYLKKNGKGEYSLAKFTLRVLRGDDEGSENDRETPAYIGCTAFGDMADHAGKYLHKGMMVFLGGHISTGSYINKQGQKVFTTEVIVTEYEPEGSEDGFMSTQGMELPFA